MFSSPHKYKIEKARYPGMEIFYQTEISFSNSPARTINNHRLYVQMGEEGESLALGVAGVIFKQWRPNMSIWEGLWKICWVFFLINGNSAPKFPQKAFSFLIWLFTAVLATARKKSEDCKNLWCPIWREVTYNWGPWGLHIPVWAGIGCVGQRGEMYMKQWAQECSRGKQVLKTTITPTVGNRETRQWFNTWYTHKSVPLLHTHKE